MRKSRLWGLRDISRGEAFASLCALGFANGSIGYLQKAVLYDGLGGALLDGFGISVLVWIAVLVCPVLMLQGTREVLTRSDLIVAALTLTAFMLPVAWLSWIALTFVAFYILYTTWHLDDSWQISSAHRAAWILLATTTAMFWGRVLMAVASNVLLRADAILISWITWRPRLGNTLQFTDGAGYIWIEPACSSLHNISLAILCWTLFAQLRGLRWSIANVAWCALACLAVIATNAFRISLMILYHEHFDLIHGPTGSTIASCLTIAAMITICTYGSRRGGSAVPCFAGT